MSEPQGALRLRRRDFRLGECAVALLLIALLGAILFSRFTDWRDEAEQVAVRQLVATLRLALQVEAARTAGARGSQALEPLAGHNPMDWLERKPANYRGEVDILLPDVQEPGTWVFERRDKTLVYLTFSDKKFPVGTSKLLRFKVEFSRTPGVANTPGQDAAGAGLVLTQISGALNPQ